MIYMYVDISEAEIALDNDFDLDYDFDYDFDFDFDNDFRVHPCSSVAKTHPCKVFSVPVSSSTFDVRRSLHLAPQKKT